MITAGVKKACMPLFVLFLIPGLLPARGMAQAITVSEDVRALLKKMQQAYQQADYLSFHMNYVYANDDNPNHPTDSLQGEVQLDKDRCRFVIDNTETILTGKYSIRIMNDEKLIYLSGKGKGASPLPDLPGIMDSLLTTLKGLTLSVHKQGIYKVLDIHFPPGQMYSRISLTVDPVSGLLQQAAYAVRTISLVGKEMVASPGHDAPYQPEGIVSVVYSKYEHHRFDDGLFDENQIFTHVTGRYEPVGQYKEFHIFLASPNL